MTNGLLETLHGDGPAPELAEKLDRYAFLVGSWETRIAAYDETGGGTRAAARSTPAGCSRGARSRTCG